MHSHLNIVWYIQLGGGWWEKSRDVNTKEASDWHVHGAQFGWRHTQKEPNTGHLMTLREQQGHNVSEENSQRIWDSNEKA